jgi:hypothetical protein
MDERKDKEMSEGRVRTDGRAETKRISSVRDLEVYRVGFEAAMEIFGISKKFPLEEKYSLTDQVRRSPRSVCITPSLSANYWMLPRKARKLKPGWSLRCNVGTLPVRNLAS